MNATAAALAHRRRDPGRGDGGDVARAPAVLRDPLDQRRRRRRPQQRLDDPRQRRAQARRQLRHAWTCARCGAPSSRCRGCAWRSCAASGRIACASSSRSIGRSRIWGSERAAPRSSSTASARCSRPTSATSRTTTCRRSPGPTAARRTCWRCSAASRPALAPLGARVEALALSGRGSWQATLDTGAVVELGRGSDDDVLARAARFVATVDQVTSRYQPPARIRRPAPQRRLRGAAEGRVDDDRRRATRRRRRREEGRARWPRKSRTWSSASTSAPPR